MRKRRGRSEGSIFQRESDGLWVASASAGYGANGKRRRKTVYGTTKQEAQEKLRAAQDELGRGLPPDAAGLTVKQFVEHWLENVQRPKVQPTTYVPCEVRVRRRIVPLLGRIKLVKLSRLHVEQMFVEMERDGDSPQERHKTGKLLRQALRSAVEKDLIPNSPAAKVPLPTYPKVEMHVFDAGQVAVFLEAAESDRLYAMYVLALDSGMRQGELFGLQWNDIDFAAGSVQVQRSLEEIKGRHRLKETKSAKSRRRIKLSQYTLDALHEHRKRMLAEGFATGPAVFCDTDGGWLRKSNVHRGSFKRTIARAGLPYIRFHDLRHTAATLLLMADVNVKIVSERLGHATIQLTLDTYSHVLPGMQERAAEKLDGIFSRMPRKAAAN